VVTGQSILKGKYKGVAFISEERWTDVFVKKTALAVCRLTGDSYHQIVSGLRERLRT
jgi:hypothetical protein